MIGRRILQIIPSENWFARFRSGESADEYFWPLSCWALVENRDGTMEVVGMGAHGDLRVDFPDESDEFTGYVYRTGVQPESLSKLRDRRST